MLLLHKDTCCWVHVLDGQRIFTKDEKWQKKIHYPIFFDVSINGNRNFKKWVKIISLNLHFFFCCCCDLDTIVITLYTEFRSAYWLTVGLWRATYSYTLWKHVFTWTCRIYNRKLTKWLWWYWHCIIYSVWSDTGFFRNVKRWWLSKGLSGTSVMISCWLKYQYFKNYMS